MIQESKLSSNSKSPSIQNFTTVGKGRRQGHGDILTLIHKSINFSQRPESPEPHLEKLTITDKLVNTELITTNVYINRKGLVSLPYIMLLLTQLARPGVC